MEKFFIFFSMFQRVPCLPFFKKCLFQWLTTRFVSPCTDQLDISSTYLTFSFVLAGDEEVLTLVKVILWLKIKLSEQNFLHFELLMAQKILLFPNAKLLKKFVNSQSLAEKVIANYAFKNHFSSHSWYSGTE